MTDSSARSAVLEAAPAAERTRIGGESVEIMLARAAENIRLAEESPLRHIAEKHEASARQWLILAERARAVERRRQRSRLDAH